jgi:NADH-quinone oxidoreductase subunit L
VAYAEQGAHGAEGDDDHAVEAVENHGDETTNDEANGYDEAEGQAEVHYAFAGEPGQGAIYVSPDNTTLDDAHSVPIWVKLSPFIAMVLGFATAWLFYIRSPHLPRQLAQQQAPLYNFLLNKWYFDELYAAIFIKPAMWLGRFLWKRGDGNVIDGGLNGIALGIIPMLTRLAGRAQSGYVFTYAFAMVIGLVVILTYFTITGNYD